LANGFHGFWVLGSVFLVLTGCEALYADMGHFGRSPIRRAWEFIVFPCLVINYLGQGSLLLQNPASVVNPFYLLAPHWALYPVLIISTLATVVASQALISGVFSLSRQAILLGYCPRLQIIHTSSSEIGQIYIPQMNWAMMIATIWLVLEFRTSSALASAYGIAVSITMLITTLLACYVAVKIWKWRLWMVFAVGALFVSIDCVFLIGNIVKIPDGGWFPLAIAGVVFALMTTWKRGRRILAVRMRAQTKRFAEFVQKATENPIHRIEGTAIYMTSDPEVVPPALAKNFQHNQVLHKRVVLLSVSTKEIPRVDPKERVIVENFPDGFHRVLSFYGFVEIPNIHDIFDACGTHGLDLEFSDITFFLGRETLIAARRHGGMALWREHLFAFMSRNAQRATQFFHIPPEQVVEIGSQIDL
jgi:KUP system potassium uptake protein